MKIQTKSQVSLTYEEVARLLTKLVEKKTNKKVISNKFDAVDNSLVFDLAEEVADLDAVKEPVKEG